MLSECKVAIVVLGLMRLAKTATSLHRSWVVADGKAYIDMIIDLCSSNPYSYGTMMQYLAMAAVEEFRI